MPFATLDGIATRYEVLGSGPPLLMFSPGGFNATLDAWSTIGAYARNKPLDHLTRHYTCIVFDRRETGQSGGRVERIGWQHFVAQGRALLDHLGIASCRLAGHSYGGGVALEFAARHAQRVSHLAILDTKVNRLQPRQMLADSPYLSPFEEEVATRYGHDWNNEPQVGLLFLEVLARWRLEGGHSATRDDFTPFGEGRGAQRAARQWLALLEQTGARGEFVQPGVGAEDIARLPMPVLLVYGAHSRCLPSCHALQKLLPQAQLELVPEGGHFFPISHAAPVRRRLSGFFGLELPDPAAEAAAAMPQTIF